jgi:ATP-dependent Clp protease ATP-binding subunit ClpA
VVLLDEIDRLHPAARDLLYQFLGEGRLTTLDGEVVSCANAVVFMTTNTGSRSFLGRRLDSAEEARAVAATRQACVEMLGAAVASRLTRVLVFPPLGAEHAVAIIQSELARIAAVPALIQRGIVLKPTSDLVAALAQHGMSRTNGARGLHKLVHEVVAVPMARYLSDEPAASGRVVVDAIRVGGCLGGVRIHAPGEGTAGRRDPQAAASEGDRAHGPLGWH